MDNVTPEAQRTRNVPPGRRAVVAVPATSPTPRQLTDRESEVAELCVRGSSSREIAAALHLSVRTVDNLLGRVYASVPSMGVKPYASGTVEKAVDTSGAVRDMANIDLALAVRRKD